MDAHVVTWSEFAAILLMGAAPVYVAAALAQAWMLRRARVGWSRVLFAITGAVIAAIPLTLVAWWASGMLPAEVMSWLHFGAAPSSLSVILVYVGVPALVASAVAFPGAAWLAKRSS